MPFYRFLRGVRRDALRGAKFIDKASTRALHLSAQGERFLSGGISTTTGGRILGGVIKYNPLTAPLFGEYLMAKTALKGAQLASRAIQGRETPSSFVKKFIRM